MPLWKWSQTAATNATADSTINWAEGQAPSTVNDSARAMMAAQRKWFDDISAATTTGGSSTAYTLASSSTFTSLGVMNGSILSLTPHATNTGNPQTTLAVDGLAAQPIRSSPSVEVKPGDLILGATYLVQYNSSAGVFYLVNFNNSGLVPVGTILPSGGGTLPPGWLWCDGAAVSRTTYAALFAVISTFWGVGNGSTTFNVPTFVNTFPIGGASMPSTAGSIGSPGYLSNTPSGTAVVEATVNWMIKF